MLRSPWQCNKCTEKNHKGNNTSERNHFPTTCKSNFFYPCALAKPALLPVGVANKAR